ncbi:efflux RND transporter periplasmic adaptor subunit [Planctobacterium marinum]|uniref:RND transporter n=1 Tax=Planctobacterium marinum TaxID=1631968 RepID=A0AA48HNZ0_9ALTE|nr:RND transporter [Planctobacterium marinum]
MKIQFNRTGVALCLLLAMTFSINSAVLAQESLNHEIRQQETGQQNKHQHGVATTVNKNKEDNHIHDNDSHEAHSGETHSEDAHAEDSHAEEEHSATIELSAAQIATANIVVTPLVAQKQQYQLYAPGEIKANGYTSYLVSPRTDSVVISRHTSLGEHVKTGQILVTLFSEAMAEAQAEYLFASTEWQRVQKLNNQTVSDSNIIAAKTAFNAAYGKLIAFGLTTSAIDNITTQDTATFGQYALTAQRAGVVLQDDFLQGQRINAGETIMLLADESELWVEARISPDKPLHLATNSPATVLFNGESYPARVIQEAHTIDTETRTRIIRLAVKNQHHHLHSGMFVQVYFQFNTAHPVLAVPERALMRDQSGNWTIFVEESPGLFEAQIIERGRALGELREISGLAEGARVVTEGAFFVMSELAKGGFEPHNH